MQAVCRQSVLTVESGVFLEYTLLISFYCCGGLALPDLGRFLVEFATMYLCKRPGLFAGPFETAQGYVEGFIFSDFY